MEELRSWWEVPSIAHFCSLFRAAFDLSDFDIEDLEEALLDSERDGGCDFLVDLVCKLLNGCYGRDDICSFNYDLYVKDIIKYKWEAGDNPIRQKSTFSELTLREKVEVIHAICEYRLDAEDVMDLLKGFDGDSMRVEPLGKDKEGGLYWYFYGSRLYKEDPEPKKELTKEQKKKLEREKRRERQQEKQRKKKLEREEKKRQKIERKIARRVEKKKLLEMQLREKEEESQGKRRRSGRIQKKQETKLMESSESSSVDSSDSASESEEVSSETEEEEVEEEEESNSDTEIEEQPVVEPTPQKKDKGKKTTEKPVPAEKKAGKRQPPKKKPEPKKKQEEKTENTRRSGRLRQKKTNDAKKDESEDEISERNHSDESDDDTKSVRSEVSRLSSRSEISTRSDSVKKKLPKRNARPNRKYCDSVENEEQIERQTDVEKSKSPRARRSGRSYKQFEVKEEENSENTLDNTENEEEMSESLAILKAKLKCTINSDSAPKEVAEKCNKKLDTKTEIEKCKIDIKNEKNEDINDEVRNANPDSHEDDLDDSKEMNGVEHSNGKDLVPDTNKLKLKDDETKSEKDFAASEIKNECDKNSTNDNEGEKDERNGKETRDLEASVGESSKEAASAEEKEKDETEGEELTDSREKDSPPPKPRPKPTPPPKSKTNSRWHLICTTLDDWINLAEWFKESSVRSEKALGKVIEEDFLPVLPEIIETREKEKQRRQRENELRKSARITQKQKEKMEQEKILAEAALDEERARREAEEERRKKEEQQKLEEENRLREERLKAREDESQHRAREHKIILIGERAKRLSMREERARLVAEGKEIPPELIYTGLPAQRYKDDFDSDDSRTDLLDDDSFLSLMKVVDGMKSHKDCWPFLEPVTEEQAPGYHDVIKRPMDLSKIEKKIELREYRTQHHFLSDFKLMFNNCRRFNGADSDFTSCAKTMEKVLKKLMKKYLLEESTDSYYNDEDFTASGVKAAGTEKKYRPKRQAGTKALQTVHNALKSDESASDDDSYIEPLKKPRRQPDIPSSVNSLLLQEMIEFKRKRAEQQRTDAQLSPQKPSTTQGIMIMPREEIPTDGILTLAASREIKWKIDPNTVKMAPKVTPGSNMQTIVRTPGGIPKTMAPGLEPLGRPVGRPPNPNSVNSVRQPTNPNIVTRPPKTLSVVHKKAAGLAPGQKIIKILASAPGSGITAVRQTAESVKVSPEGYLILNGKPTTIKVTNNTKIVIQPQGTAPQPENSSDGAKEPVLGKELLLKKIPTPAGLMPLPDTEPGATAPAGGNSQNANIPTVANIEAQKGAQQSLNPASSLQNLNRPDGIGHAKPAIQTAGPNSSPTNEMEMRKRQYDIAQRLLAAKRRQLMQNGPVTQKMARLDPSPSAKPCTNYANEQSKGVNSNVNPVNSVSVNVVQNVNISNDILDSYYSEMNEADKQKPVPKSIPNSIQHGAARNTPVNINRLLSGGSSASIPVTQTTSTSDLNNTGNQSVKTMSLSALTTALARSIVASNLQLQKESTNVDRTGNQLIGNTNSAITNTNQLTSQNRPGFSNSSVANNSVVISLDSNDGMNWHSQPVNDQTQPISQLSQPNIQPSSVSAAVSELLQSTVINHPATISNLMTTDSAGVQNQSQLPNLTTVQNQFQVSQSDVRPIEALLSSPSPSILLSPTKSLPNNQTLTQHIPTYSNLNLSPLKSDRQNLFDVFESGKEKTAQSVKSDDFGFASLTERTEKSPGKHQPSLPVAKKGQGKEFIGSPLNISVMEALKNKLSPGKHPTLPSGATLVTLQHQGSESGETSQEQYLKPVDQISSPPVYGTSHPTLGLQEQVQSSYLNTQLAYGPETDALKQTNNRVSITIAEDTLNANVQRQNPQNHHNASSKVIVQSLPHVQTLLGSHENYSAIAQHTAESVPYSNSQTSANSTRTIESMFASGDSEITALATADALATYIASNPGQQNVVGSGGSQLVQMNSNQSAVTVQNFPNTAEYLGSINIVQNSNTSHSVPINRQTYSSEQTAAANSERLQKLEMMFLKGIQTVKQPTLPVTSQISTNDGSFTVVGQETSSAGQSSTS